MGYSDLLVDHGGVSVLFDIVMAKTSDKQCAHKKVETAILKRVRSVIE